MRAEKPPVRSAQGKRFAIISARFYEELADWLEAGAQRALLECGVSASDITLYHVPGCFELPLAASRAIATNRFDAVVALGTVIRGQTPHFNFIAGECARGIMSVQLATGTPIGFGVLTTETAAQAEERAHPKRGDKGYEAAVAAIAVLAIGNHVSPTG